MKRRNQFSSDMLDLDLCGGRSQTVYRAGPCSAVVNDGPDVLLTIPLIVVPEFHGETAYAPPSSVDTEQPEDQSRIVYARVRACGESAIRVTVGENYTPPSNSSSPMLDLLPSVATEPLSVVEVENAWRIVDNRGRIRAVVDNSPPTLANWNDRDRTPLHSLNLTLIADGSTGVAFKSADRFFARQFESLPMFFCEEDGSFTRCGFALEAGPSEHFAGTGERFARMDLAGRTIVLENTDALGVNSPRAYKNVPFYLSSRPYGAFLHTSAHARLSLADVSTRAAIALVEEPTLDFFIIGGGSVPEVLRTYRAITGFPGMPPVWSFGTWMGRLTYRSAHEVEEIAARLRRERIPCDVLHLDTGWFDKEWVCEWRFSSERFPDPAGFFESLRKDGFRVSLWQTPYIGEGNRLLPEAREEGYLGSPEAGATDDRVSGSDFSDQRIGGHIDFSNPAAVVWYQGLISRLLDAGASAIKTDFGEDVVDAGYCLPVAQLHNRYALLYQRAAYEQTKKATGDGIIWARAGWAGCQRYPVHWGGDAEASWDGMAGTLRGGLHLGLSGFAFWSHDVPGFHGNPEFMHSPPTDALYARWTQFGVLSSHLRYHGTSPREPWHFPAVAELARTWLRLRYALLPYVIEQSRRCTTSGLPMVRALIFHHEYDPVCWHVDDEYYFGDDLLVAPVMDDGGRRNVYLPKGEWVCFWSGSRHSGPVWLADVYSPLSRMPVFVRAEATLRLCSDPILSTDEMTPDSETSIQGLQIEATGGFPRTELAARLDLGPGRFDLPV